MLYQQRLHWRGLLQSMLQQLVQFAVLHIVAQIKLSVGNFDAQKIDIFHDQKIAVDKLNFVCRIRRVFMP